MWSQAKLMDAFRRAADEMVETVGKKNADYAGATPDALGNFKLIEVISDGRISAEDGIIVRKSDKLARLATLATRPPQVADESFETTCYDDAAYSLLLAMLRRSRTEPDDMAPPVLPAAPPSGPTPFERLKALLGQRLTARREVDTNKMLEDMQAMGTLQ